MGCASSVVPPQEEFPEEELNRVFVQACARGDTACASEWLDSCPPLDVAQPAWEQGLTRAYEGGHVSLVCLLLQTSRERSLDTAWPRAIVRQACQRGQDDIVRHALQLPAAYAIRELVQEFEDACKGDHADVVSVLITVSHWKRLNMDAGFRAACASGASTVVALLMQQTGHRVIDIHARNEEAFRSACGAGHSRVVELLLGLRGPPLLNHRPVDVHAVPESGLWQACRNGHVHIVVLLLGLTGPRAVDVHRDKEAAFRVACERGHVEVVRLLLGLTGERAVNVHANGEGALLWACRYGHTGVVRLLLALPLTRSVNVNAQEDFALRWACRNGHPEVVRLLLTESAGRADGMCVDAGAQNGYALRWACKNRHLEVVRLLLQWKGSGADPGVRAGQSPRANAGVDDSVVFREACEAGHLELVQLLLHHAPRSGIDVGALDEYAFRAACASGHTGVVELLLSCCFLPAPPYVHYLERVDEVVHDARARAVQNVHAQEEYAFRMACANGHVGVVTHLLALQGHRAVDVHAQHEAGLRRAFENGHMEVVRLLLEQTGPRSANVHVNEEQLLRWACRHGHTDRVAFLLALTGEHAVDVHARAEEALCSAWEHGHADVADLLTALTGSRAVDMRARDGYVFREAVLRGHVIVSNAALQCVSSLGARAAPAAQQGHLQCEGRSNTLHDPGCAPHCAPTVPRAVYNNTKGASRGAGPGLHGVCGRHPCVPLQGEPCQHRVTATASQCAAAPPPSQCFSMHTCVIRCSVRTRRTAQ